MIQMNKIKDSKELTNKQFCFFCANLAMVLKPFFDDYYQKTIESEIDVEIVMAMKHLLV